MNLDQYLSRPGAPSMSALARLMDCHPDQLRQWRDERDPRRPSPTSCARIEAATEGAVTCEELRPDLKWARIPDPKWRWSRKGRPVHDVSKVAA